MKAINYSKTQGVVRHFRYFENKGSQRPRTTWYPLVDFKVNDVQYSCYGSKYQHEELFMNDTVTVLYNKADPNDAYVYSALGFWAPTLVYLVPLVLVISLLFGLDYSPKKSASRLNSI